MATRLLLGDCLDHLREMPDESIDAVVTDPPYGLSAPPDMAEVLRAWLAGEKYEHGGCGFMAAEWDSFVPGPRVWREVLRVLKPGGHAVVFAGTRTVDLMGIACRLAGFEVRDMGRWLYYSGFPKSLDIAKEVDKMAGHWRGRAGGVLSENGSMSAANYERTDKGEPITDDARRWEGWGTGLKPSGEPWLLLRKPIRESSIARQVLATGTGALNIDACRYAFGDSAWPGPQEEEPTTHTARTYGGIDGEVYGKYGAIEEEHQTAGQRLGRFPANLHACPKASRAEREAGCESLPPVRGHDAVGRAEGSAGLTPAAGAGRSASEVRNGHPTVKPVALMRWLVRLVTPPGGTVLDPFMGSGTTGVAAKLEGFDFVGCELDVGHLDICRARIKHAAPGHEIEGGNDHVPDGPFQQGLFG